MRCECVRNVIDKSVVRTVLRVANNAIVDAFNALRVRRRRHRRPKSADRRYAYCHVTYYNKKRYKNISFRMRITSVVLPDPIRRCIVVA